MSRHTYMYKKTKLQLCQIKTGMDGSLCNIRHISIHLCHHLLDYKKFTYRYFSFRFYNKFLTFYSFLSLLVIWYVWILNIVNWAFRF
jgi:hypothetical protein